MKTSAQHVLQSRAAVAMAALVSVIGGLWLMLWFWPGGLPYDSASGVWTTLADDAANGQFYRPVMSELGYGGTRHMPLFFSLHGGLITLGLPATAAGLLLTLASIGLVAAGAYRLMRALGSDGAPAVLCVGLLPASIAFQLLTISIKGDLLAVALSLWGLANAVAWGRDPGHSRLSFVLAATCFAAAVLTKFTAVFALVSLIIWLAKEHRWKQGVVFAAVIGSVVCGGLGVAFVASDGRIVESFAACATGGTNFGYAWKFPFWFVCVAVQDPFFCVLLIGGVVAAARRMRRVGLDLAGIYFAVALLGTVLLFASPGIDSNHLIDLLIASLVLIALELTHGGGERRVMWVAGMFAGVMIATWLPGAPSVRHFLQARGAPSAEAVREIERRLPAGGTARLLAENPLVPLTLGMRPEVLDCFSLRLIAERSPELKEKFFRDLGAQAHTAVVLVDWSGAPEGRLWDEIVAHKSLGVERFYGEVHFPAGFLEALERNYRLSFAVPPFVVFEPRGSAALRP